MNDKAAGGRINVLLVITSLVAALSCAFLAFSSRLLPSPEVAGVSRTDQPNGDDALEREAVAKQNQVSNVDTASVRLPTQPTPADSDTLQKQTRATAARLISAYPEKAAALHVAAMMHAQMRETAEAKELWGRCLKLAPEDPRYTMNFATVAMEQGDNQTAAEMLGKLVESGKTSLDVLLHYGMALTNKGDAEKGKEILTKAVEQFPEAGSLRVVLGQALLKLNELPEAIESLSKAVDLGVNSSDVYFNLATAHRRAGNNEQADQFQKQFDDLKQDSGGMGQQRFQTLSTAEMRRTAVTILIEAGSVYVQAENYPQAEICLLQALALEPTTLAAYQLLAAMYQATGQLANEQAARQRLLDLEPFRFEHLLTLAQVSAELKQVERAEGYLKLAVAQQPETLVPYVAMAEFYLDIGKAEQATVFAQEAADRFPSVEGYEFLAKAYKQAGNVQGEAQATANAIRLRTSGTGTGPK